MKLLSLTVMIASLSLSACVTRPNIDYSKVDQECGLKCQMNDQACASRFSGFPLILQANCNPEVEACVKACPPNTTPISPKVNFEASTNNKGNSSVTDRLNELNMLRKNGIINDSEYAAKKQEILKSL
ncbi:MAG: SHOCT domain-containing protein [Sulfuriferula sp.]|nr:SHOCT domain-containing protein [Sulfuriferula sp.]